MSWTKTCGKTTDEMGRKYQKELMAAEYKRVEETRRGQGYLEANL
jgi:hypothetical protein